MTWTKVEDALPATDELVQIVRGGVVVAGYIESDDGSEWWDALAEDYVSPGDKRPVTHWAPLLSPPAVEDEIHARKVVPFDDYSDVKILAVVDGWAMIQRIHTVRVITPMVMNVYDLQEQVKAVRAGRAGKDGDA